MATSTISTTDSAAAQFYVWHVPGKLISIHLSLAAMERLKMEWHNRRDSSDRDEICGVLIGHVVANPHTVVVINRYEVLKVTERVSRSLVEGIGDLSQSTLAESGGDHAIGFFRTQSTGWLSLAEEDQETAKTVFFRPENVVLLVRFGERGEATGAFFIWEGTEMRGRRSYHEFPLDPSRSALGPTSASIRSGLAGQSKSQFSLRLVKRLLWALSIIVIGSALVTLVAILHPVGGRSAPAHVADAGQDTSDVPIGLRAETQTNQLKIAWKHDAPAVLGAASGVMTIDDGGLVRHISIDKRQLREGSVTYEPLSEDVDLRLEVTEADGSSIGESIRVIGRGMIKRPNDRSLFDVLGSNSRSASAFDPSPAEKDSHERRSPAAVEDKNGNIEKKGPRPFVPPQTAARKSTSGDHSEVQFDNPPAIAAGAESKLNLPIEVRVSTAPPSDAAPVSAAPSHIQDSGPATQSSQTPAGPVIVPAKVLHKFLPALRGNGSGTSRTIVLIARVNAAGNVERVELAPESKDVDRSQAAELSTAVRQWKFQPALVNGRAVASEVAVNIRIVAPQK